MNEDSGGSLASLAIFQTSPSKLLHFEINRNFLMIHKCVEITFLLIVPHIFSASIYKGVHIFMDETLVVFENVTIDWRYSSDHNLIPFSNIEKNIWVKSKNIFSGFSSQN